MSFVRWFKRREIGTTIFLAAALAISIALQVTGFISAPVWSSDNVRQSNQGDPSECDSTLKALYGNEIATKARATENDTTKAREYANLCQNIIMARATQESAKASEGQFRASVINLIFVAIATGAAIAAACFAAGAVREGRRAARAGEVAAKHAEDGAKAAWAAVGVASDSTQRQLRAYFAIESGGIEIFHTDNPNSRIIKWNIVIRNCGQTPAYAVTTRFQWDPYSKNEGMRPEFNVESMVADSSSITGAGSHIHIGGERLVSSVIADGIERGSWDIAITGRVDYRDIFDSVPRHFMFDCRRGIRSTVNAWSIGPTEKGYQGN